MNLQALFDAVLAVVCLALAFDASKARPAWRLSQLLLAAAAILGALRFSQLLPMPSLHQFFSMLGAGVGLPLLAMAVIQPDSAVATQRRFAWIYAIVAATACIFLVMVAQIKAWTAVCALLSALSIVVLGVKNQKKLTALGGLLLLMTLTAFALKLNAPPLLPGDVLHIGMSLSLLVLWMGSKRSVSITSTSALTN
ncbi:hypothetical protein [Limnohabitans sp. Bal53]|jgi:hypothetical protein|uniref:hypothetical protein n=1 Tax=Limnohabitans sp. Bal53 TaxID=1977910 RepID=UPI000D3B2DC7|nr:hypothetical protein [Limnohabitans sp. Bal53]PUE42961.1 hypothetical protein B9Z50_03955 [Limnohabitans sp. Bal53]